MNDELFQVSDFIQCLSNHRGQNSLVQRLLGVLTNPHALAFFFVELFIKTGA